MELDVRHPDPKLNCERPGKTGPWKTENPQVARTTTRRQHTPRFPLLRHTIVGAKLRPCPPHLTFVAIFRQISGLDLYPYYCLLLLVVISLLFDITCAVFLGLFPDAAYATCTLAAVLYEIEPQICKGSSLSQPRFFQMSSYRDHVSDVPLVD